MTYLGEDRVRAWNGRQTLWPEQHCPVSAIKGNHEKQITRQCRDSIPELQDHESALPAEMPLLNL